MMVSFYGYDDGRRDLLLLNETKDEDGCVYAFMGRIDVWV